MNFYNQELHNIGKIIALGGLNLSLNLKLEKEDIQSMNINLRDINSLKDLSFIIDNEQLWERIELSSKSELLNTLIHMNRIKKIKNIVAYLVYDKMVFTQEQKKFQKILDFVLLNYGVVIYSYSICKCRINISFNLIYKNKSIKIMLYGDNNDETNTDNKEECKYMEDTCKEEENDNEIGLFSKIPEKQVNFNDFKYLYIHFSEYNSGGEFYEIFKLSDIYNYIKYIKINFKIKIIMNFCENFRKSEKYLIELIKIVDIHIFRNKSDLLELLIKKKEIDDLKEQKNNQKLMETIKIKKFKNLKHKLYNKETKSSIASNSNTTKIHKNSREKIDIVENKSQSLKNILIRKSIKLTLNRKNKAFFDKHNIFNYINDIIYNSSKPRTYYSLQNDKLGIYLDTFKKIYIVKYKMFKPNPEIREYEFNIYPKSNIHNLKQIESIRKILYSNYALFSYMIYGCIISTILDDIKKGYENYYLFYLYIRLSILKILSVIKNRMHIPTNREFYIVELKKEEINKIISDENNHKKEKGFINEYSSNESDFRFTKKNNFFPLQNDKFGILFKKTFNGSNSFFANSTKNSRKKNNKTIRQLFKDKIHKNKNNNFFNRTIWTKKHDSTFSLRNKFMSNFSIYLTKELKRDIACGKILPLINKSKNRTTNNFFNPRISILNIREKSEDRIREKEKSKENKENKEISTEKFNEKIKQKIKANNIFFKEKKVDTSKYIEIKFQPTQTERDKA